MTAFPRACARCRALIPAERVEAIPETQVCVKCSQAMGGEFKVVTVAERTSKAGSLKINYGSYGIKKIRKPIRPIE